ncbi:MAG: methylenetetrahydrofolate reductase [NAD(P)H] [Acidibrevibacterium sp.]|jgi:methylenetetrahydrofolate reductase (NADPH)|uniref:methylenetetrahydrofolate reductase [NAD(P)H] n=1 Tax=Acidibrevibacterium fodinaquatile TaxID=1969806 RepID=UPI0023A8C5E8|nr:methylenetetrahydrofolate reductase [NAD(P)H] [Acidibrevibacterium fodinaquatile]MCA7118693.1 methylenetetrahydrofolate reductase [NAD(P)H] [Acidibrevibacterium fodinaquatile]
MHAAAPPPNGPASPPATLERWLTGPRIAGIPARDAAQPPPLLSFEFFPPRNAALEAQLWHCIRRLERLAPRFVSVTYGAGGTTQARTHATVARIVEETSLTPAAHLTCVGAPRAEIDAVARHYWAAGVRHIVALRGDPPPGEPYRPHPEGYAYAADLVAGLRRIAPFEISVAAYPETHPQALSPEADLDNLKRKLDAGATRAITQYFFETETYLRFLDRALAAGITAPIVPGIMPVSNYAQAARFSALCGASVPAWLGHLFAGTEDDAELRRIVGALIAAEQVRLLQANGVDEFHFYTLNRPDLTYAIAHILGVRPRPDAPSAADKAGAAGTG